MNAKRSEVPMSRRSGIPMRCQGRQVHLGQGVGEIIKRVQRQRSPDLIGAQAGNQEAFRHLVEEYQQRLYAIAYNILYDYEAARDISQEAWLKIYESINQFDISKEFYPWAVRIVTNRCIDYLRRRRPKPLENEVIEVRAISAADPAEEAEREENRTRVRKLLQRLPVKYRTALVLSEIEGLPGDAVARILGTNKITARWRLHRARQLFKKLWEKEKIS